MSRSSTIRGILAVAMSLAAARGRAADAIAFTHEASIYQDVKEGPLNAPEGVACDAAGHVVVADTGNGRLVTYSMKEGRVAGGSELKIPQLAYPQRLQIDGKGNLFALDGKAHRIVRVEADGKSGTLVDVKAEKGQAVVGSFKLDPQDVLYVLDIASNKVLVADAAGSVARQVDLPREGAVFTDIAVDAGGTIYAVDAVGASVWSVEKGGTAFKALARGMKDRMSFPTYITASKGRLYLVDQNGSGIVLLGVDGSYQGRQLSIGWGDGLVNYPAQLCLTDNLAFIADRYNNRVQAFSTGK